MQNVPRGRTIEDFEDLLDILTYTTCDGKKRCAAQLSLPWDDDESNKCSKKLGTHSVAYLTELHCNHNANPETLGLLRLEPIATFVAMLWHLWPQPWRSSTSLPEDLRLGGSIVRVSSKRALAATAA